jgi:hypothetical protein
MLYSFCKNPDFTLYISFAGQKVTCSKYCKGCLKGLFKIGPCREPCEDCGNDISYLLPSLSCEKLCIFYCFLKFKKLYNILAAKGNKGTLRMFQLLVSSIRWQQLYHELEICFCLLFNNKHHKNAIYCIQ